jgi:hypothetical protein
LILGPPCKPECRYRSDIDLALQYREGSSARWDTPEVLMFRQQHCNRSQVGKCSTGLDPQQVNRFRVGMNIRLHPHSTCLSHRFFQRRSHMARRRLSRKYNKSRGHKSHMALRVPPKGSNSADHSLYNQVGQLRPNRCHLDIFWGNQSRKGKNGLWGKAHFLSRCTHQVHRNRRCLKDSAHQHQ